VGQYQLSRLGVSQPNSVYILPAETRLLLSRRERWIFNNRGVILTLIIPWLGPSLSLFGFSEAIWSEGFAKGPWITEKHPTSTKARTRNPQNADSSFPAIELSWPPFEVIG